MKESIFKQFEKPTGLRGRLAGHFMALNNIKRSDWTIDKLNFKPTDKILEIGYGPGITLKMIAEQLTTGSITGIDHSEVMCRQAIKRNEENIKNNKAEIMCGTVHEFNYPENHFDIIFGSNVHFFWKEPVKEFKILYKLLNDNGRLVFVFQPRYLKSNNDIALESGKTKSQFMEADFKNIEIEVKHMKPIDCIYIRGNK